MQGVAKLKGGRVGIYNHTYMDGDEHHDQEVTQHYINQKITELRHQLEPLRVSDGGETYLTPNGTVTFVDFGRPDQKIRLDALSEGRLDHLAEEMGLPIPR